MLENPCNWTHEQIALLKSLFAAGKVRHSNLVVLTTLISLYEPGTRWSIRASYRQLAEATHYTLSSLARSMNELFDGQYLLKGSSTGRLSYKINADLIHQQAREVESLPILWSRLWATLLPAPNRYQGDAGDYSVENLRDELANSFGAHQNFTNNSMATDYTTSRLERCIPIAGNALRALQVVAHISDNEPRIKGYILQSNNLPSYLSSCFSQWVQTFSKHLTPLPDSENTDSDLSSYNFANGTRRVQ